MIFKAVIFDLDDTLYSEFDFVKGGYRAAAGYLKEKFGLNPEKIFSEMLEDYRDKGRDQLFDRLVKKYELKESGLIERLLKVYREHKPQISLYDDVLFALKKLASEKIKTGLITDGLKSVQQNKVTCLGLDALIGQIVFTDDLGPGNGKPSTKPFEVICNGLGVDYAGSCYIGDNPAKDFLAPNRLDMASIRLKRGMYQGVVAADREHSAKFTINSLMEIFSL